jgi:hypothetical protein
MKFEFCQQIFEKVSNIKFHQNPLSGSRVPCGQTDMKLTVAFRNFANAPKQINSLFPSQISNLIPSFAIPSTIKLETQHHWQSRIFSDMWNGIHLPR